MTKVYCKDCKHAHITTSADCYATQKPGRSSIDYVEGGVWFSGDKGIVSCSSRNKKGKCKYYEEK